MGIFFSQTPDTLSIKLTIIHDRTVQYLPWLPTRWPRQLSNTACILLSQSFLCCIGHIYLANAVLLNCLGLLVGSQGKYCTVLLCIIVSVMLSVIRLNVVTLNVGLLNVVTPFITLLLLLTAIQYKVENWQLKLRHQEFVLKLSSKTKNSFNVMSKS
jgi:hypothetical protein